MQLFTIPDEILPASLRDSIAKYLWLNAEQMPDNYVSMTKSLYNPAGTLELLESVGDLVSQTIGRKVYPVCTFGRVYGPGAELFEHTDRPALQWTVSLCLQGDDWELEGSIYGTWQGLAPSGNNGVLVEGKAIPHRRQAYTGMQNIVLLLHYSEDKRYLWDGGSRPIPVTSQPHYAHIPKLLSETQIERLYSNFDKSALVPGMVTHGGIPSDNRANMITWLRRDEGWQWLYDHIFAATKVVNERHWRLDIEGASDDDLQFTRYEPGEYYGWHSDSDETAIGDQIAKRSLSVVILLRVPIAGGGLELRNGGLINMGAGDAVVFPSYEEHRALEVTEGIRDSLILWLSHE